MLHVHGVTRSRIVPSTSTGWEKSDTASAKSAQKTTQKSGIENELKDVKMRRLGEQKANDET